MLVSLRDDLQNTTDLRSQVRWPFSSTLEIYPLEDDGTVTDVQEGTGMDISFSGIAFWTAKRPAARFAYVNLKAFPELAPFVVLVQIVRVTPTEAGYRLGAAFVTTGIGKG